MKPSGSSSIRRRNNPTTTTSSSEIARSFGAFLEGWLVHHEHYLDELQSAIENRHTARQEDLEELADRVLMHYQQYYDEKSGVAERDASILFSTPWFTRLERSLLWVAGIEARLAVKLVMGSFGSELTEDQARRMEGLRARTRMKENELNDELAQLHEIVAWPPILQAARRCQRPPRDGEEDEATAAVQTLRARMEVVVVANADLLRRETSLGVMEILSLGQSRE